MFNLFEVNCCTTPKTGKNTHKYYHKGRPYGEFRYSFITMPPIAGMASFIFPSLPTFIILRIV